MPHVAEGIERVQQRTFDKSVDVLGAAGRGRPCGDGPDHFPRAHLGAKRRTERRCSNALFFWEGKKSWRRFSLSQERSRLRMVEQIVPAQVLREREYESSGR